MSGMTADDVFIIRNKWPPCSQSDSSIHPDHSNYVHKYILCLPFNIRQNTIESINSRWIWFYLYGRSALSSWLPSVISGLELVQKFVVKRLQLLPQVFQIFLQWCCGLLGFKIFLLPAVTCCLKNIGNAESTTRNQLSNKALSWQYLSLNVILSWIFLSCKYKLFIYSIFCSPWFLRCLFWANRSLPFLSNSCLVHSSCFLSSLTSLISSISSSPIRNKPCQFCKKKHWSLILGILPKWQLTVCLKEGKGICLLSDRVQTWRGRGAPNWPRQHRWTFCHLETSSKHMSPSESIDLSQFQLFVRFKDPTWPTCWQWNLD